MKKQISNISCPISNSDVLKLDLGKSGGISFGGQFERESECPLWFYCHLDIILLANSTFSAALLMGH